MLWFLVSAASFVLALAVLAWPHRPTRPKSSPPRLPCRCHLAKVLN